MRVPVLIAKNLSLSAGRGRVRWQRGWPCTYGSPCRVGPPYRTFHLLTREQAPREQAPRSFRPFCDKSPAGHCVLPSRVHRHEAPLGQHQRRELAAVAASRVQARRVLVPLEAPLGVVPKNDVPHASNDCRLCGRHSSAHATPAAEALAAAHHPPPSARTKFRIVVMSSARCSAKGTPGTTPACTTRTSSRSRRSVCGSSRKKARSASPSASTQAYLSSLYFESLPRAPASLLASWAKRAASSWLPRTQAKPLSRA